MSVTASANTVVAVTRATAPGNVRETYSTVVTSTVPTEPLVGTSTA